MSDAGRIDSERLLLRPLERGDWPVVQGELSRVEMARMLAIPHPYPEGGAIEWIATTRPGREFAMTLRDTGDVIGAITITVSENDRRGTLGYWCAAGFWGNGYATEAVRAVIEYAFRTLELNRVYAECHGDNPASRRVLEKAGMTLEGRLRLHSFRVDRLADKLQFGVLSEEW